MSPSDHSATRASVLGGGTGRARPGEVSRAHHGVLFLDELPEFARATLEALVADPASAVRESWILLAETLATLAVGLMLMPRVARRVRRAA